MTLTQAQSSLVFVAPQLLSEKFRQSAAEIAIVAPASTWRPHASLLRASSLPWPSRTLYISAYTRFTAADPPCRTRWIL